MKTIWTIAGFDPSSGAGVTADLMVFAAHGFFGASCITSLTVQSTLGVRTSHPVDAGVIADTLACLYEDLTPAGIKIGMLGTKQAVNAVCGFLEELRAAGSEVSVIVDPVLRASSGRELLASGAAHMLRTRLLPLVDWITPNAEELGWLTATPANNREQMTEAAAVLQRQVREHGKRQIHVLAKGGDLDPPDDYLLLSSGEGHWLPGVRVETTATHGTGCALSSALLCRLVLGDAPVLAAQKAKHYVAEAMRRATSIGHGRGPMNHLWPVR